MTSTERVPPAGPTTTALADLRAFLAHAVGDGAAVEVAAPDGNHRARVCLWPLGLLADQGTRGGYGRHTLRLRARHVVTPDGPLDTALGLLDRMLVAIAGNERFQLVPEPVPAGPWHVPGTPRPSLLIDVPVQIASAPPAASRVTGGLRLDGGGMRIVTGRLVGPGDVALAGMTVASSATGTSVVTDPKGGFVLPGQPAGRAVPLQLSGRGLHLRVEVGPEATDPVVVHCPLEEV